MVFVRAAPGQPLYSSRPRIGQASLTAPRQIQSDSGRCPDPWRPAHIQPLCITAAVYFSQFGYIPVGWNWIATKHVVMLPPPLDSEARRTVEVEPRRPIDVSDPSESLWPSRMRAPHARRLCPRPLRPRVFRQHLRFRGLQVASSHLSGEPLPQSGKVGMSLQRISPLWEVLVGG